MKELIEQLQSIIDFNEGIVKVDGLMFDDSLDVEEMYKSIQPKEKGFIDGEEIEQVKQFIGYTPEMTNDELRAIRNSIVKYYSDNDQYGKGGEFDPTFWDKCSAFTSVIDMLMK